MADTPATPSDDPFDIGDTDLNLHPEATPRDATPAERSLPPRSADGKFTKPEEVAQHPAHLVRQAIEFGLDEADLADISTPTLYKTINRFLAREREVLTSVATQRSLEGAHVAQPVPAPPVPEPEDDLGDMSDFDPRLVEALKKVYKGPREEIKALKAALAAREQQDAIKETNSGHELIDFAFAKLSNPLLGEGTGQALAADPAKKAEFSRRVAVLGAAGITDLRKVNRLTIMKQLREANELLFGTVATPTPADPYTAALSGQLPKKDKKGRISGEEWANGAVARPSQRNGSPELKGEALAIKNLTEKMREHESQRTDDAELEGLPD